jgi:hypothetical protein
MLSGDLPLVLLSRQAYLPAAHTIPRPHQRSPPPPHTSLPFFIWNYSQPQSPANTLPNLFRQPQPPLLSPLPRNTSSQGAATKRLPFLSYSDLHTIDVAPVVTHFFGEHIQAACTCPTLVGWPKLRRSAGASVMNFGGGRNRGSIAMLDDIGGELGCEGCAGV